MSDRHRAPPEPPAAANGLWLIPAGLAVLAATVAVASLLGPSPDVPDAVESPRRTVAQSGSTVALSPLNVPTPTVAASETAVIATSARVSAVQPRRVSTVTPQRTTSAPEAPTAALPDEPIPPAEEPAAPIEETAVAEPEQPAETAEPYYCPRMGQTCTGVCPDCPTETEPTEATTPPDVVGDIFDVTEPEVTEP